MDPRLAEIYGTNEETSDVEKTAAAELAEKLAGEENDLNLDGLSSDEIEALAKEVLSANDEPAEETPAKEEEKEEKKEDGEKTASQQKIEEADYLGRVMAHAYVHELKEIEKTAAAEAEKTAGKGKVATKLKLAEDKKEEKKDDKKMPPFMKKDDKKEDKEKKSSVSAFDTLAIARAREILEANGVELEEEKKEEAKAEEPAAEEKKASASKYDVLAKAVEARAVELLKSEGYEFEE